MSHAWPSRRSPALAAAAGALAVLLTAACGSRPAVGTVGAVIVLPSELSPSLEEAGLDVASTVRLASEALASAGLQVRKGARRSHTARVEVVSFSTTAPRAGGPPDAEVSLELELSPAWASGPVVRRSGRAAVPLKGGEAASAWRQAFRAAAAVAAEAAALDLREQAKPTAAVVADLGSPEPAMRERAVRALASRGSRASAKAIAERVRDPDPGVVEAAVSALASLRDPGTVLTLIEAAQTGGAAATLRLLPVLEEIGGPDVHGYLLTLASGHPEPAVRQAAADALAKAGWAGRGSGETKR